MTVSRILNPPVLVTASTRQRMDRAHDYVVRLDDRRHPRAATRNVPDPSIAPHLNPPLPTVGTRSPDRGR